LHDKEVVLTVTNPHVSESRSTEIAIRGGRIKSGTATVLAHSDIHAHNTFEQRDAVSPRSTTMQIASGNPVYAFVPASVTKLVLTLA